MKQVIEVQKSPLVSEIEVTYKTKVKASDRLKVTSSRAAYEAVMQAFNRNTIEHVEEFAILLLNRNNQVLGWYKLSKGGISGTVADLRVIFQLALSANASAVILAHNHPSGNTNPSEQDKSITKQIIKAGEILQINVLDHLIVTADNYLSFSDDGLM